MTRKQGRRTEENAAAVLVRMPRRMAADLAERAARQDLNREQLIRRILREWIESH